MPTDLFSICGEHRDDLQKAAPMLAGVSQDFWKRNHVTFSVAELGSAPCRGIFWSAMYTHGSVRDADRLARGSRLDRMADGAEKKKGKRKCVGEKGNQSGIFLVVVVVVAGRPEKKKKKGNGVCRKK